MKLTVEELTEAWSGEVYNGIEYAKSYYLEYPDKPTKPTLKHNHSSEELKKYNSDFKTYETELEIYKNKKEQYGKVQNEVDGIIEKWLKDISGFTNHVPDDKKDKVWYKAWQDGHSSGYSEVYSCLCSLVDLFM